MNADAGADAAGRTVAIVLRTRDRPILLARALCGILEQRWPHWHVVLVNGGDPEPVRALAETYATAFGDRLTVLQADPGSGPNGATALGLAHPACRGADWVALHDDDDAWHPEFLRAALRLGDDGAGWAAVACHGWRVEERMEAAGVVEVARQPGFSDPNPLDLAAVVRSDPVPAICLLMRRDALDRMPTPDGADLATALLLEGEIGVVPRRLAFSYRRRDAAGPYANRSGQAEADAVAAVLRRNRLLRAAPPGGAGLLPALAVALAPALGTVNDRLDRNGGWGHGRHADTQERLIRLEAAIAALERTLRPFNRLWSMLARLKRR